MPVKKKRSQKENTLLTTSLMKEELHKQERLLETIFKNLFKLEFGKWNNKVSIVENCVNKVRTGVAGLQTDISGIKIDLAELRMGQEDLRGTLRKLENSIDHALTSQEAKYDQILEFLKSISNQVNVQGAMIQSEIDSIQSNLRIHDEEIKKLKN